MAEWVKSTIFGGFFVAMAVVLWLTAILQETPLSEQGIGLAMIIWFTGLPLWLLFFWVIRPNEGE